MSEFLLIIIGIVLIANCVFIIWSFYSLRRTIRKNNYFSTNDDLNVDHIIYVRSSINLIYASIAIITFVLAFLGFNLKDKITQDVTREISNSAKVDLEALKFKVNEIALMDSVAIVKGRDINSISEKVRTIYSELNIGLQRVYVVKGLNVSPKKRHFDFSELRTINDDKLPSFTQSPAVLQSYAYFGDGAVGFVRLVVTREGIEVLDVDTEFNIDLSIYPRK
jgi:hypothetical protein